MRERGKERRNRETAGWRETTLTVESRRREKTTDRTPTRLPPLREQNAKNTAVDAHHFRQRVGGSCCRLPGLLAQGHGMLAEMRHLQAARL
jgi:hypothetical protein